MNSQQLKKQTFSVNSKFIPLCVVAIAAVVSCLLIVLSALYMFPLPGTDARAFIPPAIRYSSGAGLDNPISPLAFDTDLQNQDRFYFYTPLFPWLVGFLMPKATTQAAFMVAAIMRVVAVAWLSFLLVKIANRTRTGLNSTVAIVIALMVFSYAGMFLPTVGRPEILASIFLVAGVTIVLYTKGLVEAILQGCIFGLLGATHPAGAVIAVAVFGLSCAVKYRYLNALRQTTIVTVLGVLVCLVLISISPNGLLDTLAGLKIHSDMQIERNIGSVLNVIKYWVFWPDRFFFGPILVLTLFLFSAEGWFHYKKISSPLLSLIWLLIIFFLIWFFGVRVPPTSYNLAMFQPITYCVLIYLLFRVQTVKVSKRKVVRSLACLMLLASLVSPVRTILMYQSMLSTGKTYAAARNQIETAIADGQFIFFTGSTWALSENYEHMWPWKSDWKRSSPPPSEDKFLLQQEARTGQFRLPENASLELEWRSFEKPKFFGLPLSRSPSGYGFSLWELNNGSAPQSPKGSV